jgi:cell division protease FtsH
MAMGGKVAEELVFGKENVTSGAASDIQQVSKIARAMVTQFGFSDGLGNIDYANQQESYLGSYQGASSNSQDTQEKIDEEVRKLVDEGYETAKRVLTEHSEEHHRLAEALLEYETLTGAEITKVMAGERLNRDDDEDDTPSGNVASLSSIPKTKTRVKPSGDAGAEPEPEPSV